MPVTNVRTTTPRAVTQSTVTTANATPKKSSTTSASSTAQAGWSAGAQGTTQAQLKEALSKAFPKWTSEKINGGGWALSKPGQPMNTPYIVELKGNTLRLNWVDYTDVNLSTTVKPGTDIAKALASLKQRLEAGEYEGAKAPPKGWPTVAKLDQLVVDALPKFLIEASATPGSYIGGLKSNPGYEVMVHVKNGEVRISRLDDRTGRDQSVRVPLKVGDDFKKVIAGAMTKLLAKKNDPVPQS